MPAAPLDASARNFRLNVAEGVAVLAAGAFLSPSAILPLYVAQFTDARWTLGLIPAVATLGLALPQLAGAWLTARAPSFWRTFCLQSWLPRLAAVLLAATPLLPGPWALVGFFGAFALYQGMMGLNAPVWFEMVAHVIPAHRRGAFLGLRNTFGGALSMAALAAASGLLAVLPAPWSFVACFGAAAGLLLISLALMLSTRHDWTPVDARREAAPAFAPQALALWREHRPFRRYLAARLVLNGSVMATAFYAVAGMERFGLSASRSSLFALALVYAPTLVGVAWGRVADAWGNKRLLVPAALAAAAANAWLAAGPPLPAFVACLFVTGAATVILGIVDSKWLIELDGGRRTAAVGFFNLALMPAAVALSLGAGALAEAWGIGAVFAATAAAWAAGAAAVAFGVAEPARVAAPLERAA